MVEHNSKIVKLIVRGGHGGLPYLPLLTFAVADHGVNLIALAAVLCSHGHADRYRQSLTERAGAGIHAGGLVLVGMTLEMTAELTQSQKLLLGEEALVGKHRVQRGTAMTLAKHEAVALRSLRICRVDVHNIVVQCGQRIDA